MHSQLPDWDFIQNLLVNEAVMTAFSAEQNPIEVQNILDDIKQQGLIACIKDDAVFLLSREECRKLGILFKHQIYTSNVTLVC